MPRVRGRNIASYDDATDSEMLGPSRYLKKITTNVNFPDGECRFLWVGVGGTATITQVGSNVLTDFPLKEGLNQIMCLKVVLGTASDVWAGY